MRLHRREFICHALAGAGIALIGGRAAAQAPGAASFDPAEVVPLGRSGLKASRVGLGTGMRGGMRQSNQTRLGREGFERLIRGCHDRGIRFFDLADMYGSHPFVMPALKGLPRDGIVVSSKIWFRPKGGLPETERPDADVVVERFLREIGTDYLDLVQLHCVVAPKWNEELRRQMDLLAGLKKKGLVRAHGVSCHSLDALKVAASEPWVDVIHARINPYGVKMDGPAETVAPVLRAAHEAGRGVIGMKIVGEGEFRNDDEKRNRSVEYALTLGTVDTMIVGFESLAEVDDFAARVRRVKRG